MCLDICKKCRQLQEMALGRLCAPCAQYQLDKHFRFNQIQENMTKTMIENNPRLKSRSR